MQECRSACPTGYYAKDGVCFPCESRRDPGRNGCKTCKYQNGEIVCLTCGTDSDNNQKFLREGQCRKQCALGFFESVVSGNGICSACSQVSNCRDCVLTGTKQECVKCDYGFFLKNDGGVTTCVNEDDDCGLKWYETRVSNNAVC